MSPSPISIGIIGFGQLSERVHLPILSKTSGIRIVAIAEADASRRLISTRMVPRGRIFDNFHALLADPKVDAVVVSLPTGLHAEAAIAARLADKHLYLEKPLATDLDDGRKVITAWRKAPRVAQIGFNYRWHPLVCELRARVQAGDLGKVHSVHTRFHSRASEASGGWKRCREEGGGVLLDLASHHFDLLPFLFASPIATVQAIVRSVKSEGDVARTRCRLVNDVEVESSFSLVNDDEDIIEVQGAKQTLVLDRLRGLTLRTPNQPAVPSLLNRVRLALTRPYAMAKLRSPQAESSFKASLRSFIDTIRRGDLANPSLEDGFRSLCVVLAAERASQSGQEENVEYSSGCRR